MEYKLIDKDNFLEYDLETKKAEVLSKAELTKQITEAETRLKEIPVMPDDKELLEWAKANYPMMNYDNEVRSLRETIALNKKRLESL